VLFAHGGLVSEADGLTIAQKHLNWWLNNRVYPIYFAWQSGPAETLIDELADRFGRQAGAVGFSLVEQLDRLVEKVARSHFRWMWDQMKENAAAASRPIAPPPARRPPDAELPGASLVVERLARYVTARSADGADGGVRVHLVGHSAGSIFLAALLDRLAAARVVVDSMALLAPAIRVDAFAGSVLRHLGPGKTVRRFATFAMTDERELNDACGARGVNIYQKSLLYLVSRALERPGPGDVGGEVRLVGMQRFFDRPLAPGATTTLREAIAAAGGASIFSRSTDPDESRSDATSHGGFDDDAPTMTSVVMRLLRETASRVDGYTPNAALKRTGPTPVAAAAAARAPRARPAARAAAGEPLKLGVAVEASGEVPREQVGEPQTERPSAPHSRACVPPEVAVAPESGSPTRDVLERLGWRTVDARDAGDAMRSGDGGGRGEREAPRSRAPAAAGPRAKGEAPPRGGGNGGALPRRRSRKR
jgi:hypothetical protein